MRSFEAATHVHLIEADLTRAFKKAAGREGVTLFAALAGMLASMLARMSGSPDIVLAVPLAGQTLLADTRLVGHLVNLLPVRLNCDPDAPLREHLRAASSRVLDAFEHGDTTYGAILRAAGLAGAVDRQPLSEVQFNLDQQPADFGFAGLRATMEGNPRAYSNFDLIFNVTESAEGLRIDLTHATDTVSPETAARWCRQFHALLGAAARDMGQPAGEAPMLPAAEARALLAMGEGTDPADPPARIEAMVAARALATPDAVAIEDGAGTHSYADLDRASARLAATLAARLPQPGARVAVMLDRSMGLVAAMLAVMRAGHAYVPLDPRHPPARSRAVLEAAQVAGLIHAGDAGGLADGLDIASIDIASIDAADDAGADAGRTAPGRTAPQQTTLQRTAPQRTAPGPHRRRLPTRRPRPTSSSPPAPPARPRGWRCRTRRSRTFFRRWHGVRDCPRATCWWRSRP